MMRLARYNPMDVETALRQAQPWHPFPTIDDRVAWQEAAARLGGEAVAGYLARAEELAKEEISRLPATLYLEFRRTGERPGYQEPMRQRRAMMTSMALAECLEDSGRYLDRIMDVVWAICEESSWAMPAHQSDLTDMERPVIDLGAAGTGIALAECMHLLGNRLDPAVAKRVKYEVNRRLLTPFLTRHDFWWQYNTTRRTVNNWTAVCVSGVVGAGLYLEDDVERLAEIVSRGARSMDDYLDTFDRDGGSTEGPGYWGYGYGNFAVLAQLVEAATNGVVTFMDDRRAIEAAKFPLRAQIAQNAYANFSDCDATVAYPVALLVWLSRRLEIPGLMQLARQQPDDARAGELHWALRNLLWRPDAEPAGAYVPAKRDYFEEMQWMFARMDPADPNALGLAAKGGHNGEMHNQNDVGSFIVRWGGEAVLTELGRGRYTRAYFGPQRYEFFINSSLGHPVPIPNGKVQLPGKEYRAQVLEYRADDAADRMTIEMRGAYPAEADLASLKRTFALHREGQGWVEVIDEVAFGNRPGTLESAVFTFGTAEVQDGSVLVKGESAALRVAYDAATVAARVETCPDLDLGTGPRTAQRVLFGLREPAQAGTIRLEIRPV